MLVGTDSRRRARGTVRLRRAARPAVPAGTDQDRRRTGARRQRGVVIAAIMSCTNTSNPSLMVGAGPLEKGRQALAR
jgi:aconitase A